MFRKSKVEKREKKMKTKMHLKNKNMSSNSNNTTNNREKNLQSWKKQTNVDIFWIKQMVCTDTTEALGGYFVYVKFKKTERKNNNNNRIYKCTKDIFRDGSLIVWRLTPVCVCAYVIHRAVISISTSIKSHWFTCQKCEVGILIGLNFIKIHEHILSTFEV